MNPAEDRLFAGSIPQSYQRYLVPMVFEPYAVDMARRVAQRRPARVLELAAGTGVLTRHLAATLPAASEIVATDLNQPMLDEAAARGTPRPVQWRQADAQELPFEDGSFDVVACQFGVMFFPDKPRAFREARRVLRRGGVLLFNVWDRIEDNEFADVLTQALALRYPSDPPRFMARGPHGYHETTPIAGDLTAGGFDQPALIEIVPGRSHAASAHDAATGYCHGSPLRAEIEAREPGGLAAATDAVAQALAARFGSGAIEGRIQARVVTIER